jgi:DNA invertase Pin-like site-specific DNA recombinase
VLDQMHAILDGTERKISMIYVDAGISGVTLQRPALQQLIADCRAGKIAAVVTQAPERLSRNSEQLLALMQIFRETDVRVEFITGSQSISYLETLAAYVR